MPRRRTDGRHTHKDGEATCVALSHINTATLGKHQTQPPLFCQSPRPIVSDPSLPSIIISPAPLNPFKCQVDGGLICRYRLTTGGLITREAATSEHCVESRRHTGGGEESALYLATTTTTATNPPHPTPTNHPTLNKNNLRGSAVGTPGPEREKRLWNEGERSGDALMSHTCHHRVCLTRCRMCRIMQRCVEKENTPSCTCSSFT